MRYNLSLGIQTQVARAGNYAMASHKRDFMSLYD